MGTPVFVPPLPEQRKIATILGTWDEAIALTERRIAAGQQRKQGLMQRLLTGRVRFPEFIRSADTTETPYGDLPADWKYVSIVETARGAVHETPRAKSTLCCLAPNTLAWWIR